MARSNQGQEFYPYCLKAVVKSKVWGGRRMETLLGKQLPAGEKIGETWEAWDGCTIENGPFEGMTLAGLVEKDAETARGILGILGPQVARERRFPLLFKFIDAQEDLSVQVHPDDAQAQAMEGQPFGKTEAWYILDAEPTAHLILGFKQDVAPEAVTSGIQNKTLVDLLSSVPVEAGDVLFVPAGTVHAITKGIVLAEIQENSDITYRFYDWGRQDKTRELHIRQSLAVSAFKRLAYPKIPSLTIKYERYDLRYLVACRYFAFERLDVYETTPSLLTNDRFQILSVIEGKADILYGPDTGPRAVSASQGQTMVLPARLGAYKVSPTQQPCRLLRAFVPDLVGDVVNPLLQAGYEASAIARLGGSVPEHNDLVSLVQ